MAVFHNSAIRRRWFFLLTLLAFGLALGAGGVLWYSVETSSVLAVQARIQALIPLLTAIRVSLIALVAIAWPWVANGLHRWGHLDAAQASTLLALRWRIVSWLVVIELVLGQNLLGQLLMAFQEG
ncbi:MAG TPA: histidine kinase [Gammaproteobacteria bacterium]|nr:histidine kinase [Gammaproteobacteria bacterium]